MAENQIMQLKTGTLVVRLKTNERSIAAYRASGNTKLADKLAGENRQRNLYLMLAFINQFNFCRVLFIEAQNTRRLLDREDNIYLNGKLQVDSSIKAPKGFYLIAEFGEAMRTEEAGDPQHSWQSATPGSSAALVISDSDLNQLKEPFPYSVDMVFARLNFSPAVVKSGSENEHADAAQKASAGDTWLPSPYDKGVFRLSNRFETFYNKVLNKTGQMYHQWPSPAEKAVVERGQNKNLQLIKHELELIDAAKEKFSK
jgi:hypothetical protein